MPRPISLACATALAALLAIGPAAAPVLAQGLGRDAADTDGRAGDRTSPRFRSLDPLVELPRTAEPRSSALRSSGPRSSDPSEGERRETRDGFGARSGGRDGGTARDGSTRAPDRAPADPSLAVDGVTAQDPSLALDRLSARDPRGLRAPPETDPDADADTDAFAEPEIGPYDPIGVRVGSFLVFPDVNVETLYTDNVFESSRVRKSDTALAIEPSIAVRSNWSRHSLTGEANGVFSFFREFSSEDDKDVNAALRGRIDITRRTSLEAETTYVLEQESRSSINVPDTVAERPDEQTTTAALQLDHRINRVDLRLRGEIVEETFQDVRLLDGDLFDNAARDNTEHELTARVGYAFKPEVSAFVQGSVNEIVFERPEAETGVRRDSTGYELQAGLAFELVGTITGEVAAGYARQTPDDPSLRSLEGPVLDANLSWRATPLTTFTLNAQAGIDASTSTDSPGSLNQTVQVAVEHVLRRYFILGASLAYEIDDFGAGEPQQRELIGSFSAEYLLTRSLGLIASYTHDRFDGAGDNDYTANEVRVGVRLRR